MLVPSRARRRGPRGFTIAEMVIVVAVCAVVAAVGIVSMTRASDTSKRSTKLKTVFAQLQQLRAKHLSTSGGPDSCLRIEATTSNQLELEERSECTSPGTAQTRRLAAVVSVRDVCIDNLGRGASCNAVSNLTDIIIDVDADGRPPFDGRIVWGANGRLVATFPVDDDPEADAQAHLVDVSASVTPQPTAVGQFGGSATNPSGLLQ